MTDEDRIAELLLRWEEAFDHGQDLTAEELCAGSPELLEPLKQRIAVLKQMVWVKDEPPHLWHRQGRHDVRECPQEAQDESSRTETTDQNGTHDVVVAAQREHVSPEQGYPDWDDRKPPKDFQLGSAFRNETAHDGSPF